MNKDHSLMIVLSAIVMINIVAILLLSMRIEETSQDSDLVAGGAGDADDNDSTDTASALATPSKVIVVQPSVKTLVIQEERCPRCFDITKYVEALKDTINMDVENAPSSIAGLLALERLPAIAFNGTLEEYPSLLVDWESTGSIVTIADGPYQGKWYVLPTYNPPYYSLTKNVTRGIVNVTFLKTDCDDCYGLGEMENFLDGAGIVHDTTIAFVGTPKGDGLVKRYNITVVPTIIMESEAREYPTLRPGWDIVGTVEYDGAYVLRDLERMGLVYYDLRTKKVMKP